MAKQREPILSAEWINARILNVIDRMERLVADRLIRDGLLSSGYPPGEMPVTDAMLARMSAEELTALLARLPAPERVALYERIRRMGRHVPAT